MFLTVNGDFFTAELIGWFLHWSCSMLTVMIELNF